MKKVLISIIIVLTLSLLGLWGYLLLYGTPDGLPWSRGDFEPEQAGNASESSFNDVPTTPIETGTPISLDGTLIELSSRPTAGAVLFTRDDADFVRYVERGTGHIFEINLQSGATERISNTTIPRATEAIWNRNGTRVVITSEIRSGIAEMLVGTLVRSDGGGWGLETFALSTGASNVAFLDQGDALYYLIPTATGSAGHRYDLKTGTDTELFSIPLREVTVVWDTLGEDTHYVHTNPSAVMRGFLYQINKGALTYVHEGGNALMARRLDEESLLVTIDNGTELISETVRIDSGARAPLGLSALPQKCALPTFEGQTTLWCASSLILPHITYPDAWMQGAVTSNDALFTIEVESGDWTVFSLEDMGGEVFDVIQPMQNERGTQLIYINKRDGTLWLVNLDQLTAQN